MQRIFVKDRMLVNEDGTPFFYLADTAWELAHRLNREEIEHYFAERSRQGFTAAQIVVLAEFEGITVPNVCGRLPLKMTGGTPDPTKPDVDGEYSFWDHLDFIVETAEKAGMFAVLLPTWGDKFNQKWGKGPEIFTPDNAKVYGRWIAARYADRSNIIWMLGGDRPLETPEHRAIVDSMAEGIRQADTHSLITFHPPGCATSADFLADADYIDFHTSQTGHSTDQCYESDRVMAKMRAFGKPYLDSEPRYEDHPACFDASIGYYWNAHDVRVNAYRDVLAGACGHTYGNHCIWSMTKEPTDYFPYRWDEALIHTGAEQIAFVKKLRLSRDPFDFEPADEIVLTSYEGEGRVTAARGERFAYVFSPLGLPFTVECPFANAKAARAAWFDPRTGEEQVFTVVPPRGKLTFAPPKQGEDWLLILDACR